MDGHRDVDQACVVPVPVPAGEGDASVPRRLWTPWTACSTGSNSSGRAAETGAELCWSLVELVRTAHDRGMRVIADLVVNHTSSDHPWFQQARPSTENPFRDYYIWRAEEPPDTSDMVVFHDEEKAIWTQDEITGHWYLHRFYKHQPDLNLANPKVRDEIAKIVGFWWHLSLDGFRVDAVPQLLTVGLHDEIENSRGFTDPHAFLRLPAPAPVPRPAWASPEGSGRTFTSGLPPAPTTSPVGAPVPCDDKRRPSQRIRAGPRTVGPSC